MSDLDPVPHAVEVGSQGLSSEDIHQIAASALEYVRAQPREHTQFGDVAYDPKVEMMIGLDQIPDDIGRRFDSHGIAKGLTIDQVSSLNQLLTTGIDPSRQFFHSAPLKGAVEAAAALGAGGPLEGAFIILGEVNKPLTEGIRYVLTNTPFVQSIPLLSGKFPQVEFIPILSAAKRLQEVVTK